jgi:hypothetical protein
MKKISIILLSLMVFTGLNEIRAQEQKADQTTTSNTTSIAKGLGLFVFPSEGQTKEKQDTDEFDCYKWAMEQTGYNPINPPEIQAEQVDKSPDGTAIVGAAGGAAAGAAIGAIAGDAGKGAAIGAVAGGLRGRRAKVVGDAKKQQSADQAAAAKQEELLKNFVRAFSVCLEGKGYTVK